MVMSRRSKGVFWESSVRRRSSPVTYGKTEWETNGLVNSVTTGTRNSNIDDNLQSASGKDDTYDHYITKEPSGFAGICQEMPRLRCTIFRGVTSMQHPGALQREINNAGQGWCAEKSG